MKETVERVVEPPKEPKMIQKPLPVFHRCEVSAALLERVSQLQSALTEIETSLQEKHLRCCLFPELGGVEELTKATVQLGARHIGALIAVERNMSLNDFVKSGTLINAELSASLLLSLFYPGNLLHDGAVIIRNEKIIAGGCILPLSADHNAFKVMGLGTRHRAGVGLSQVSDAAVFIVSEQSGRVTLALGGHMFHEPLLGKGRGSITWLSQRVTSDTVSGGNPMVTRVPYGEDRISASEPAAQTVLGQEPCSSHQ